MKWLTALLLAGLAVGSVSARMEPGMDSQSPIPGPLPVTPVVPAPQIEVKQGPGLPTQVLPAQGPGSCNCADGAAGKTSCAQKIKAFFCYHPTAGNALPKLQVHPYIGPWVGTFGCTSAAGYSCGDSGNKPCGGKKGCATSTGAVPDLAGTNNAPVGDRSPITIVPPSLGGFPGRNCQGGTAHQVMPGQPADQPVVAEFEFQQTGACQAVETARYSGQFIAAIEITRQFVSPRDALVRSAYQP